MFNVASDIAHTIEQNKDFHSFVDESDHPGFLSNSFRGISNSEFFRIFGSSVAFYYEEEAKQKTSSSYRSDARGILARITRVNFLLSAIEYDVQTLSSDDRVTSEFKSAIQSEINTAEFGSRVADDKLQKVLSLVIALCADEEERQKQAGELYAGKPLRILSGHIHELSEHVHYFHKKKYGSLREEPDEVPFLLLELEKQRDETLKKGGNNKVEHQLLYARSLAETGLFGLEDIAREAIGGAGFVANLKEHFYAVAQNNRRKHHPDYRNFYIRFGVKYFKHFVDETLGAVLFSSGISKRPEEWTLDDVKQISSYVYSRYQLVHDVIEGLANEETNPLGSNLTKEQTLALMCETLRSSIYPNYKIDIRVGIGGTHQSDVLIRVGSYVMNALDTLAVYTAANEICTHSWGINVPSLTLVSGAALAERVNGLDPVAGKRNEQSFLGFISKFVGTYYPDLSDGVNYVAPTQEEVFDNDLYKALLDTAKEITDHEINEDQDWSETYEKKNKAAAALTTLTNFASKRKQASGNEDAAREMALQYAVAHITPSVFQSIKFADGYSDPVWKIGGRSEKPFDVFGEALVDLLRDDERFCLPNGNGCQALAAGICTTTTVGGNPPPYYRGPKGSFDPGLNETIKKVSNGSFADKSVVARIRSEVSGPAADMRALLTHKRIGNGDIARGWGNYKSFLMNCEH